MILSDAKITGWQLELMIGLRDSLMDLLKLLKTMEGSIFKI